MKFLDEKFVGEERVFFEAERDFVARFDVLELLNLHLRQKLKSLFVLLCHDRGNLEGGEGGGGREEMG